MIQESNEYIVTVKAITHRDNLNDYDRNVAGVYLFKVPATLDHPHACEYALDAFHNTVAIAVLDDFDISVSLKA